VFHSLFHRSVYISFPGTAVFRPAGLCVNDVQRMGILSGCGTLIGHPGSNPRTVHQRYESAYTVLWDPYSPDHMREGKDPGVS
jgi:hypothetical protein